MKDKIEEHQHTENVKNILGAGLKEKLEEA
jgi:hypothetical protein